MLERMDAQDGLIAGHIGEVKPENLKDHKESLHFASKKNFQEVVSPIIQLTHSLW